MKIIYRIVLAAVLCLCLCTSLLAATPQIKHQLDIHLKPSIHRLEATDQISLSPSPRQVGFWLNSDAEIRSVTSGINSLPYTFHQGRLTINLPPGLYGQSGDIQIAYSLKLPDSMMPTAAHHEDPGYGISAALGPAGAFLGGGSRWYPQLGEGRPLIDIQLTVPADWEAVTNGKLIERLPVETQKKVRYQVRLNRPGLAVAAGPWLFSSDQTSGIPIYAFFSESNEGLAPRYLEKSRSYINEYSKLLGPYPFAKFAIGENFFPSGYGYASWTLLGKRVIRLPFILTSSLPHEIVHNWFGNGVLVDYAQGNWCEGLTTYLADYRSYEKEGPSAALEYRLRILRSYAALVRPEQAYPLTAFQTRTSKIDQVIGYGKVMMVFHMLRQKIGEEPFWQGLKRLVVTRMNRSTGWRDIQQIFEQTSNKRLGTFFNQWITYTTLPQLKLANLSAEPIDGGWSIQGEVQQTKPFYSLDIPLQLQTRGGIQKQQLQMQGDRARFQFQTASPPIALSVDPQADLMRKLYPSEVPPTVNNLRASKGLMVVLSSQTPTAVREGALSLLKGLRKGDAVVTEEESLSPKELRGKDILFIGPPQKESLLPGLPSPLTMSRQHFSLGQDRFNQTEDVLFSVQPHSASPGKVMALFWPKTASAAQTAARKIPHYGKYSYLIFRDGVNAAKGTWPAQSSPLIHQFNVEGTP